MLVHLQVKKSLFTLRTNTKLLLKQLLKLTKKSQEQKVNIKSGDQLGGLDKLSLDNQIKVKPLTFMMAPYDRVGSLGTDGQLSEVKLSDGAKTDDTY